MLQLLPNALFTPVSSPVNVEIHPFLRYKQIASIFNYGRYIDYKSRLQAATVTEIVNKRIERLKNSTVGKLIETLPESVQTLLEQLYTSHQVLTDAGFEEVIDGRVFVHMICEKRHETYVALNAIERTVACQVCSTAVLPLGGFHIANFGGHSNATIEHSEITYHGSRFGSAEW